MGEMNLQTKDHKCPAEEVMSALKIFLSYAPNDLELSGNELKSLFATSESGRLAEDRVSLNDQKELERLGWEYVRRNEFGVKQGWERYR